ncbi:hypothetical protein ACEQPO_20590 [Bacillus sp. SL00103]
MKALAWVINFYVTLSGHVSLFAIVDMSALEDVTHYEDYVTINEELEQYNMRLTELTTTTAK